MRIHIEYCTEWNYYPKAKDLADELRVDFDDMESFHFEPSHGGVFEVTVMDWNDNKKLVFSKKELGRFPEKGEVVEIIKRL